MARRGRKSKRKVTIHKITDLTDQYGPLPEALKPRKIQVDDPLPEAGANDQVIVFRAIRDDRLGEMHDSRHISDPQYHAGRDWQRAYETIIAGSLQALRWKDAVDGGGAPDAGDRAEALTDLHNTAKLLGYAGYLVIRDVLGDGYSLSDVAKKRRRRKATICEMFDKSLDELAIYFGWVSEVKAA